MCANTKTREKLFIIDGFILCTLIFITIRLLLLVSLFLFCVLPQNGHPFTSSWQDLDEGCVGWLHIIDICSRHTRRVEFFTHIETLFYSLPWFSSATPSYLRFYLKLLQFWPSSRLLPADPHNTSPSDTTSYTTYSVITSLLHLQHQSR